MFSTLASGADYYTIQLVKTGNLSEAESITDRYRARGFDSFTQVRPYRSGTAYLSCINKYKTFEEALINARNLKDMGTHGSFEITTVLGKHEWLARYGKKKPRRLPARIEKLNLNPKNLLKNKPTDPKPSKPSSYEGTTSQGAIENPIIPGQKFVSTEKGLFVSIPTPAGDHWENVPAGFNSENAYLYFAQNGTLFIDNYQLSPEQKAFVKLVDSASYHLAGYRVKKIYEKEGLLWVIFTGQTHKGSREPASESRKILTRAFISANYGNEWSELPAIIKKDF